MQKLIILVKPLEEIRSSGGCCELGSAKTSCFSLRNEEATSWPDKLLVPGTVIIFSTNMMRAKYF